MMRSPSTKGSKMYFAKLITPNTIDEITQINGGVRPDDSTLNNTFFVYSDLPDVACDIVSRKVFRRDYRWLNPNTEDNIVLKK